MGSDPLSAHGANMNADGGGNPLQQMHHHAPAVPGSLTARRPNANHLSGMSLPPLPFRQTIPINPSSLNQKSLGSFPHNVNNPNSTPITPASTLNAGNLLTPPSNIPGDGLSPISTIVNGVNAAAAAAAATSSTTGAPDQTLPSFSQSTPPFLSQQSHHHQHQHQLQQQQGSQTQSQNQPSLSSSQDNSPFRFGMNSTIATPQPWPNTLKGLFSPSLAGSLSRSSATNSPSSGPGLPPPPPFDLSSFSAAPLSTPLPPVNMSQTTAFAPQTLYSTPAPSTTLGSSHNGAASLTSPPLSGNNPSGFAVDRSHSLPTGFHVTGSLSQPNSAQASTFPSFSSPIQASPLSAPLPSTNHSAGDIGTPRFSPGMSTGSPFPPPGGPMSAYGFRAFNQGYPLPSIPSTHHALPFQQPIMTNMSNPGGPMSLVGLPPGIPGSLMPAYHSGMAAQMYGMQAHQAIVVDRPFKCDQCPQSFNRNHDLKRHRRIHLAVKPFPCGHCDKSFSRKDALKRHILVKGCGKSRTSTSSNDVRNGRGESSSSGGASGRRKGTNGSNEMSEEEYEDDDELEDDDEEEEHSPNSNQRRGGLVQGSYNSVHGIGHHMNNGHGNGR